MTGYNRDVTFLSYDSGVAALFQKKTVLLEIHVEIFMD